MVLAMHANKSIDSRPLNPDMHLMGDLIIQALLALGEAQKSVSIAPNFV